MDWGVIAATFLGPIFAVCITLWHDGRSNVRKVRFDTFVQMMKNRRNMLNPEFVNAFNLVPIYFADDETVMRHYRDVLQTVSHPNWRSPEVAPALNEQLNAGATRLLHVMSKAVRAPIEQMDILTSAYAPQGWADEAMQQKELRDATTRYMQGKQPIPVVLVDPRGSVLDDSASTSIN